MSQWEKREFGRDLRRCGLSYGEIWELIPVKKPDLASWSSCLALTDEQIAEIKQRGAPEPGIPRDTQWRRRKKSDGSAGMPPRKCLPSFRNLTGWPGNLLLGRRKQDQKPLQGGKLGSAGAQALHILGQVLL